MERHDVVVRDQEAARRDLGIALHRPADSTGDLDRLQLWAEQSADRSFERTLERALHNAEQWWHASASAGL